MNAPPDPVRAQAAQIVAQLERQEAALKKKLPLFRAQRLKVQSAAMPLRELLASGIGMNNLTQTVQAIAKGLFVILEAQEAQYLLSIEEMDQLAKETAENLATLRSGLVVAGRI